VNVIFAVLALGEKVGCAVGVAVGAGVGLDAGADGIDDAPPPPPHEARTNAVLKKNSRKRINTLSHHKHTTVRVPGSFSDGRLHPLLKE
jgi:hypothetical protein